MKAIDLSLYTQQTDFLMSEAKYTCFAAGIGTGKTVAGVVRSIRAALGWIGKKQIQTPNLGMVTAPTYVMLKDATLRTFLDIAGNVGEGVVKAFNQSDMRITLVNGSEILFRSIDKPERLRGVSLSWWYGDEAALYPESVWKIMLGRLRQFRQAGSAWLTTSPRGRNWIWRVFVDRKTKTHKIVSARTDQNPFLAKEFVDALKAEYTGDYADQELGGKFVAYAGLIYSEYYEQVHRVNQTPVQFKQVVAGVDWGWTNPGVILVGGVDVDGRLWIVHEEYKRQRRIEDWVNVAVELGARWGISKWWCDPAEPDYIRKFVTGGLAAEGADNQVLPGIQAVKKRLVVRSDGKPRLLISGGAANTLAEFEEYHWAQKRDGTLAEAPVKASDHAMDALRYLVMGVDEGQEVVITTQVRAYA